jgi:hypothetical protein
VNSATIAASGYDLNDLSSVDCSHRDCFVRAIAFSVRMRSS